MARRRRLALLAGLPLLAALVAGAAWWRLHRALVLPPEIALEEVEADLTDALDAATIVAQDAAAPVRTGQIEPADRLVPGGGPRPGIVATPPARVRFRPDLPAGSVLRFAVGVAGDGQRHDDRSGVRFVLRVDGAERWRHELNPARRRGDRRWLDASVDLAHDHDGPVELELATEAVTPGLPLAGTPAWAHVRAVRATRVARQPASAGPNLLVLLVDTLRADRLGLYGARPSPSPTLDAFAAGGRTFEQAIAAASWTLPSVASLLSGLPARSHGALGAQAAPGTHGETRWGFLADRVTTWADLASRAGVTTVGVSANPIVSRGTNLAQGFETFVELPWDSARRDWAPATEVNAAFLDWLHANPGVRFAGWLHYMEPHDPYTPPAALRPPLPAGVRPALANGWVQDVARRIESGEAPPLPAVERDWLLALYDAEIRSWDIALAELLRALRDAGVLDDTIVVVTADHGEEFLEHGRLKHGTQLYEESIHVPLVIVGPGVAPGRVGALAQGLDLLPTIAHVLGLKAPPGLWGRDLLGTLPADAGVLSETGSAIGPTGSHIAIEALRTPDRKLIATPALGRTELYDLPRDPRERDDRAAAAPAEAATLRARLDALVAAAPPPPQAERTDPALGEKLRALGYVAE